MSPTMYPHIVDFVRSLREAEPALVEPMLEVMDAVLSRAFPSDDAIDATVRAVSNTRVGVYETGSYVLGALADYDPRALQAIAALSSSRNARIRHNAILCLTAETPSETTVQVLRHALSDRSNRVRRKAADWVGRLDLRQLLSEVRVASMQETHRETQDVMLWALETLNKTNLAAGQSAAA